VVIVNLAYGVEDGLMMSSLGACKKLSVKRKESAVLEREDFDAGPTNLDCIEPGLFIGMYILLGYYIIYMSVTQDARK
jgi:hypothetical protein